MYEQLADLETELEKLETRLPEIYAAGDQAAARDAGRRHAQLRPVVDAYREYRGALAELEEARELLHAEADPEMRSTCGSRPTSRRRASRTSRCASRSCSCRATRTRART
jgi:protein subunit release factor A